MTDPLMEYIMVLDIDPADLQASIDRRARQGWTVHTFSVTCLVGRVQFAVLLERKVEPNEA